MIENRQQTYQRTCTTKCPRVFHPHFRTLIASAYLYRTTAQATKLLKDLHDRKDIEGKASGTVPPSSTSSTSSLPHPTLPTLSISRSTRKTNSLPRPATPAHRPSSYHLRPRPRNPRPRPIHNPASPPQRPHRPQNRRKDTETRARNPAAQPPYQQNPCRPLDRNHRPLARQRRATDRHPGPQESKPGSDALHARICGREEGDRDGVCVLEENGTAAEGYCQGVVETVFRCAGADERGREGRGHGNGGGNGNGGGGRGCSGGVGGFGSGGGHSLTLDCGWGDGGEVKIVMIGKEGDVYLILVEWLTE